MEMPGRWTGVVVSGPGKLTLTSVKATLLKGLYYDIARAEKGLSFIDKAPRY